ncbi:MAG TPA: glycine--tRNA ligase subunit beta [Stellaceae bacterium]|nr:glycine--tRNA ligase subunit beta [Stellaceae bacterium]
MKTGELLLELLSEEIPARMQRRALADLKKLVGDRLAAAAIPAASLDGYVTPRRLALIARGIPSIRPQQRTVRAGPRVGAPQSAIDGFLRSAGLNSIDQCEIRDLPRGKFYVAVIVEPQREAKKLLSPIIEAVIAEFPWPKSMRFPAAPFRWVRPLSSVICLFDGAVVPLDVGAVPVGRATRGQRFLAPEEFEVADAEDYAKRLAAANVVLDLDERRQRIEAELARLSEAEGLTYAPDPGLLEEVAGLAEYPVVLMGRVEPEFMDLPPEVLATAMRTHQKYLSCRFPDGKPAPRFLFVAGNRAPDGGKAIVAGNERVLRARLADARFFWDQDRKTRLEDRVAALKGRVYQDKLGSVLDKVERMGSIVYFLHTRPDEVRERAMRAARLCKADLSTGMVGEFPELQGTMGRYYALHDGEDPRVAQAIAEHYKPLGPNDGVPTAPESVLVALADKIDALVAFFAIGEKPTGSGDPYALRRAALGIIRIILENGLRLRLEEIFRSASLGLFQCDAGAELLEFVVDRMKVHLREAGVRHDLIAAAFAPSGGLEDDLVRLVARVRALETFLASDDGANLLAAYRRAANIVRIEERTGGWGPGAVDRKLLKEREEIALNDKLHAVEAAVLLYEEDFSAAMSALAILRQPVDEFFERVTVNAKEQELRENRLRLLSAIRATMNRVADFSRIEG